MFICKSKIINIFVFKKNLFEYLVHNCLTIDFRKIILDIKSIDINNKYKIDMATLLSGNHMLKRTCYIIYNI